MNIYVIRNALAVADGGDHRYLSAQGRQVARAVGARLHKEGASFDAVLASPLVRAVQTAELIAERVDYVGVIETSSAMLPDAQPRVAAKRVVDIGGDVAVVGHEPMLSSLAAFLCGLPGFAPLRHAQVSLLSDNRPVWKLLPHTLEIEILHAPGVS